MAAPRGADFQPLGTEYFEQYARVSLAALFGGDYAQLYCTDSPDLQTQDGRVAVEVTRAMPQNVATAYAMYFEMRAHEGDSPYALAADTDVGEQLAQALTRKLRRLHSGEYARARRYELYIFSAADLSLQQAEAAAARLRREQRFMLRRYSALYINDIQHIYVCSLRAGVAARSLEIDSEQQHCFHKQAMDAVRKRRKDAQKLKKERAAESGGAADL